MNNNGIYGGDRRQEALRAAAEAGAQGAGFAADPVPTAFVDGAKCAGLVAVLRVRVSVRVYVRVDGRG